MHPIPGARKNHAGRKATDKLLRSSPPPPFPGTRHLASPGLRHKVCKMGIMVVPTSQSCGEEECQDKTLSSIWHKLRFRNPYYCYRAPRHRTPECTGLRAGFLISIGTRAPASAPGAAGPGHHFGPPTGSGRPAPPGSALSQFAPGAAQLRPRPAPRIPSPALRDAPRRWKASRRVVVGTARPPSRRQPVNRRTLTISDRFGSSALPALRPAPIPFRACAQHAVETDSLGRLLGASVGRAGRRILVTPRAPGESALRCTKAGSRALRLLKIKLLRRRQWLYKHLTTLIVNAMEGVRPS